MSITVLGAGGWIGAALVDYLRLQNRQVIPIYRSNISAWLGQDDPQGMVIYAIGLTSDFRHRPYCTVEAHVSLLSQVLQRSGVDHLLYLSSTRVYGRSSKTTENEPLPCLSCEIMSLDFWPCSIELAF